MLWACRIQAGSQVLKFGGKNIFQGGEFICFYYCFYQTEAVKQNLGDQCPRSCPYTGLFTSLVMKKTSHCEFRLRALSNPYRTFSELERNRENLFVILQLWSTIQVIIMISVMAGQVLILRSFFANKADIARRSKT